MEREHRDHQRGVMYLTREEGVYTSERGGIHQIKVKDDDA